MKYWVLWMIAGVVAILAGFLALANPLAASITAVMLTGWSFLLIGVLQAAGVFVGGDWGPRLWALAIGVLGALLGLWILSRPVEALIALTWVMGIMLLALGLTKVLAAWPLRQGPFFWPVLLSGFLSAMLGMMVLGGMPKISEYLLGVFLAVELISSGIAAVTLAVGLRRLS